MRELHKGIENIDLALANIIRGIAHNRLMVNLDEHSEVTVTHEYDNSRLLIHVEIYNPRAYTHHLTSCTIALNEEHR